MHAVVLCGGVASRLGSIAKDTPKSLLPVNGRPFLEWLLIDLKSQGVDTVVLATGHLGDQISDRIRNGERFGLRIVYSQEGERLGTGGALRLASEHISRWPVLALNGDSYCEFDPYLMVAKHHRLNADATLWLAPHQPGRRYGSIDLDADGIVRRFDEKSRQPGAWISAGVYLLERRALDSVQIGKVASIEKDVFPSLHRLAGVRGPAPVFDIGVPESLADADARLGPIFRRFDMRDADGERITRHMKQSTDLQRKVGRDCQEQITSAARLITDSVRLGGKLMLCGNGGSAADCQHMAAEFTNRLSAGVARDALPALALTTDTSFITAYANDIGFQGVFARQIEGLGRPGDVLLGISTSGRSRNVIVAFEAAAKKGISTIALTGEGGDMQRMADCAIVIPSSDTQHIQEAMLPVEHMICALVESAMLE